MTHANGSETLPIIELKPFQSATIKLWELKQAGLLGSAEFGGFRVSGSSLASKLLIKEHVISESAHTAAPFYGSVTYVLDWWFETEDDPIEAGSSTWVRWFSYMSDSTTWGPGFSFFSLTSSNTSAVTIINVAPGRKANGVSLGSSTLEGSEIFPANAFGDLSPFYFQLPIASSYKCFAQLKIPWRRRPPIRLSYRPKSCVLVVPNGKRGKVCNLRRTKWRLSS